MIGGALFFGGLGMLVFDVLKRFVRGKDVSGWAWAFDFGFIIVGLVLIVAHGYK